MRTVMGASDRLARRWTKAPELVVVDTVMSYHDGAVDTYTATAETLTTRDVDDLVSDLTTALRLLSGQTYSTFASVRRESAAPGERVKVIRPGQIVVGRFKNVQSMMHTIGLGGTSHKSDGSIVGAAVILDADFDRDQPQRRLLRTHELGHALGYNHVTSRASIMNPTIGPEPTAFDRQVATVAYRMAAATTN